MMLAAMLLSGASVDIPVDQTFGDSDALTSSGSASVLLAFNSDGTWSATGTNVGTIASGSWVTPAPPSQTYYIKCAFVSGTSPSGSAVDTVLPLSGNQAWGVSRSGGPGNTGCVVTVTIYADSGGTSALDSATYTLVAETTV